MVGLSRGVLACACACVAVVLACAPTSASVGAGRLGIQVESTPAARAWLARPDHSAEERQAFLTAYEVASALSNDIEARYEDSLLPGHSFLEQWGLTRDAESRLAREELTEWIEQAKLSQHSFAEIASLHHAEVEHSILDGVDATADADLETQVEWPEWTGHSDQADQSNQGAAASDSLTGAIDAGVAAAFSAAPLRTFRFAQVRANTAAALNQGMQDAGIKGAVSAGGNALNTAAKNYVLSKIPANKVLAHAMSGELGTLVRKDGKKALKSAEGKRLLAKSQKELAAKVMQSPLASGLVQKVHSKSRELLASGQEKALELVNDKIAAKTGLDLNGKPMRSSSDPAPPAKLQAHAKKSKTKGKKKANRAKQEKAANQAKMKAKAKANIKARAAKARAARAKARKRK